jgi:hypothetical protein
VEERRGAAEVTITKERELKMNIVAFLLGTVRGHKIEDHKEDIQEAGREAARFVMGNFAEGFHEEMSSILGGAQQTILIGECEVVEEEVVRPRKRVTKR